MASPISSAVYPVFTPDPSSNISLPLIAEGFNVEMTTLFVRLQKALEYLQEHPSDAAALAAYQALLSEYILFRGAQSNTVKAYKDIGTAILQNFH